MNILCAGLNGLGYFTCTFSPSADALLVNSFTGALHIWRSASIQRTSAAIAEVRQDPMVDEILWQSSASSQITDADLAGMVAGPQNNPGSRLAT
jgi:hypothetical protein